MKRFCVVHRHDDVSFSIAQTIIHKLLQNQAIEDSENPETVFVVGGDGTFLSAVHQLIPRLNEVQFIGIHTGTLGFMTDYQIEEVDQLLQDYLSKEPKIDQLRLLEIHINQNEEPLYALNEMRIENAIKTQILDITIDGVFFETYRGTGICLATQMGSTAYNRSLKGAVIQHGLPLLELSEIAGIHHREFQSLGNSIILKEAAKLRFTSESFEGAILCYDHCSLPLQNTQIIECFNSDKSVRIARYRPYHYLTRLKNLF